MEKQSKKKITWPIKNFSSLREAEIHSDKFVVGGCKWRLCAYPNRYNTDYLFMWLEAADSESLPLGWRRHVRYRISLVNHDPLKHSKQNEAANWFDDESPRWGRLSLFTIDEIQAKENGFLVNGELKIVAEVEILEVIGKLDVSEMESVSRLFERHPEIASEFRAKNPNIQTSYISLLLSLIESLRQSPHKLLKADLEEAYVALIFLTDAGFKLDWLKKKLDQMFEKKEKKEAGETRMQEIEEELKDLKHKCSDLEAELAKEKAEVSAAESPVSFDDVI